MTGRGPGVHETRNHGKLERREARERLAGGKPGEPERCAHAPLLSRGELRLEQVIEEARGRRSRSHGA